MKMMFDKRFSLTEDYQQAKMTSRLNSINVDR